MPEESRRHYSNILPTGDPIVERTEGDGILQNMTQNIRGTSVTSGLEVPYEIEAMHEYGSDVHGSCESNRQWTPGNK